MGAEPGDGRRPPVVLFFVTEDWYFVSHRLAVAEAAARAGGRVIVLCRVSQHASTIRARGLELVALDIDRASRNPARELKTLSRVIATYRRLRPDVVHHVALKPVIYGSLAAALTGVPRVVNALAGLGSVFATGGTAGGWTRRAVSLALRAAARRPNSWLVLQNPEDRDELIAAGIAAPERTVVIRGVGVDLAAFTVRPEAGGEPPLVLLASRMLWDKGVGEFVEAARRLRDAGAAARFALVGRTDSASPGSIPEGQLTAWREQGVVEVWGHRADMAGVLAQAAVVCLPTYYREGLPKILLEAAAAGRPVITTDTPGCREAVRDGVNGFLVPPRDVPALVRALDRLLGDGALRRRLGEAGRRMAEAEFSDERAARETLALYGLTPGPDGGGPEVHSR